jgi:hypothetical protein
MAESPQTVLEFSRSLLSDLENGAITPQEALSACQEYEYLRNELSTQTELLTQASLVGDDKLIEVLRGAISSATEKLQELQSFQAQQPDIPLNETEIRDVALLRTAAITQAKEKTQKTLAPQREKRRDFIHELVSKYSSTLPSATEDRIETAFDESLSAAAGQAKTEQTKARFAEMLLASSEAAVGERFSENQRATVKQAIENTISDHNEYISTALDAYASEYAVIGSLYDHLDLKRPDVLADILLNDPEGATGDTLTRGVKLAQVAEALEQKSAAPSREGFFSQSNAKGVTKGLLQASDGILSVLGEPVRDMVYAEKVNGTLQSLLSNTQQLSDRLGEAFVHTTLFTNIAQNLSKSLSEKPNTAGAGSLMGDMFSTVFRGPLDPMLQNATKDSLLNYFELARASASAPNGRSFLPVGMAPWEVFAVSTQGRGSAFSKSSGLPGAIGSPGGMLGPSSLFSSGSRRNPWIAAFPFLSFGSLGGFISDVLASGVDRTTSFIFSGPSIRNQINSSRRAALVPTPIIQDLPLLIAIAVVATIIILLVLPSPLNLPQTAYGSRVGSLFASLFSAEGEQGGGGGSSVDCTTDPTNELCTFKSCTGDCSWPTNGYITQGPNVTCDPFASHAKGSDINAIDMATTGNVPVYAVRSGRVTRMNTSCPDDSGYIGDTCGGGYGNYVTMTTDGGYTVIYGHLKSAINPAVVVGASITIHEQLGWMDQTGSSTKQHLHFGVLSGGNVLDLLPDSPLNKSDILGCVRNDILCSAVGKGCPAQPVSAQ